MQKYKMPISRLRMMVCLIGMLLPMCMFAQQITVQGVVKDQTGETVIGASVMEKGTTNGTITGIDGDFSLNMSPNGTLVVSFVGYKTQEVQVKGQKQLQVVLSEDAEMLDEVIVVGYGTTKKANLSGAVDQISSKEIELRVDANGAFSPTDALEKLHRLSEFQLHSIEQPIRAGQWDEMARLCAATPFPIALDDELIGINRRDRKIELLETIRPQYIILKPSLHGGISGSEEWMELAAERGIGSWVTSALESNIGLNAIAQWCATLQPALPQGLGTGLLFTDNIDYPLHIEGDCLWFHPEEQEPDLLNWLKQ